MFEALKKGFSEARNRLRGLAELNPQNIKPALAEVRRSLLDADVELGVIKRFLARVEEKAVGTTVRVRAQGMRVGAEDHFIKICHDELVDMMRFDDAPVRLKERGRTHIMMVGLQGSGKTTTSAKLARYLAAEGKKPLLVAADMQRPAAVEQLKVLGAQVETPVFNLPDATPVAICRAADAEAQKLGRDVIIYDTAGRLAIDELLMAELSEIKGVVDPGNIFLVVDAMIGQDAVKTARSFNERLGITGVILTKLDGDARGGAALSVREVTGAPVVFSGVGETTDKLELFRADGMVGRILGLGDIVGIVKDLEEVVDEEEARRGAERMMSGQFSLDDFLEQIRTIRKMGPLKDLIEKMPGMSNMLPPGVNVDDREFVKIEAMIQSMTRQERGDPNVMIREPGRVRRIARGSGTAEQPILELIQKFDFMKQMMTSFGAMDPGLLGRIPGLKGLSMARNVRRAMKSGKLPAGAGMGMPGGFPGGGFPGMPGGFPGMGFPGGGFPGMPGMGPGAGVEDRSLPQMKPLSKSEKNSRKNARKREKLARKKNRGKH